MYCVNQKSTSSGRSALCNTATIKYLSNGNQIHKKAILSSRGKIGHSAKAKGHATIT